MKQEEKKTVFINIANLKKELLMFRVKSSSGETISVKEYKNKKKEVARLFTKLNTQNRI